MVQNSNCPSVNVSTYARLRRPAPTDPVDLSVSEDNIGFRLLVKHGWKVICLVWLQSVIGSHCLQEGSGLGKNSEGLLVPVDPVVPSEGHAGVGVVSKRNLMTVEGKASKELEAVQSRNSFIENCYNALWEEKCFSRVFCMELSLLAPHFAQQHNSKSSTASKVLEKDRRFHFCTNQRGVPCVYLSSMEYAGFEPTHQLLDGGGPAQSFAISVRPPAVDHGESSSLGAIGFHSNAAASKLMHRWAHGADDEPQEMWPALAPVRGIAASAVGAQTQAGTDAAIEGSCCINSRNDALDIKLNDPQILSCSMRLQNSHDSSSEPSQHLRLKDPAPSSRKSAFAPPNFTYQLDFKSSKSQRDDHSAPANASDCGAETARAGQSRASPRQHVDARRDSAGVGLYRPPQVRADIALPSRHNFELEGPRNRAGLGLHRRPHGRDDAQLHSNLDRDGLQGRAGLGARCSLGGEDK